ncbi:MAG: FecR domain-containing protein [Chitinophagaceae bacterium]|nr:FecR domain-containing protein [Chitinophagaceae bacterium]
MNKSLFTELLDQYLAGTISPEGKAQLKKLLDSPAYLDELKSLMEESFHNDAFLSEEDPRIKEIIQQNLQQKIAETTILSNRPSKLLNLRRLMVAAAVLGIIGISALLFIFHPPARHKEVAAVSKRSDVAPPKSSAATITLADGSRIALDSLTNGIIASQRNVNVIKLSDGQIAYKGNSSETVYNTLFNPRGSTVVTLTLSDGTKVWLNNESSLRYPVAFVGKEREVEITGEAYFEVFHDRSKPFTVAINGAKVEVLGTHFNINSYPDAASINTTLLEGSIKVSRNGTARLIKPGDQAQVYQNGAIDIKSNVDLKDVMAWKNGYFHFDGVSTETIMKQISRWYDVDIVYVGDVKNELFAGSLPRSANVSEVLSLLEMTKTVRFSLEEKKIVVKPYK